MKFSDDTPTWRDALGFFLGRYLPRHRGFSPETIASYATSLRFLVDEVKARCDYPYRLSVTEVLKFLDGLERRRGNQPQSRNVRLAALKCFWKAMLLRDPANRDRYEQLLAVPFKRAPKQSPDYLEPAELSRLFRSADPSTAKGFRDLAILRYFYNTGSRISEVAKAKLGWFSWEGEAEVLIRGKGGKCRKCPLWSSTAEMLKVYVRQERTAPRKGFEDFLFITRLGTAFDRKSLWKLVKGYLAKTAGDVPSLRHKRLTAHSLRHTTAVHLLRAGVDINVIKSWLGHADVETTSGYLDLDLDKKREALEQFLKLDLERLATDPAQVATPLPKNISSWLERL
jgi:site-specific recombinase XerD